VHEYLWRPLHLPPPLPLCMCSQSAVIWSGRAKAISPTPSTVFTLEGVNQQEDKVVGAYLRVSELWESGGGQERKIVAWNAAAGEVWQCCRPQHHHRHRFRCHHSNHT
jgi:hypothetical protein